MVAPGMDTPPIATLSLAVIVNVSVWVLLLLGVEYKLAKWVTDADVNPVIVGAWLSDFVIFTVKVSLVVLPAASPIVAVTVLVEDPNEKSE